MAGIYIHIPFCKQACNYCDFHFSTNTKYVAQMVDSMLLELDLKLNYLKDQSINSVYFGGGTPSIIESEYIEKLLTKIHNQYHLSEDIEITLEANPDDLSLDKLKALKTIGVNRLSIGLQSFYKEELHWMNRAHSAEQSFACIEQAHLAGFDNVSVDLIYGSQLLTDEQWQRQLSIVEKMSIQHLSCYALTIEDKTVLGQAVKSKIVADVDDTTQARHFKILQDWSLKAGFAHYEISNLSKTNKYSRHNSAYWDNTSYLGIGPAAHSYNGISRQWNISNNAVYMKLIKTNEAYFEIENLSERDQYNELVLTQLRTSKGLNKQTILDYFSPNIQLLFANELQKQINLKNIIEENGRIRIPYEKWFKADGIASDLFFVEGDLKNSSRLAE
jgi:putative oxygen-independent coproporphyrinogen III oxidase